MIRCLSSSTPKSAIFLVPLSLSLSTLNYLFGMGTDEETIWVISGISLQDALRPIKARTIEIESSSAEEEEEDGHCSTPTKKEARIAERLMCPPAPKKPKPALMCHLDGVEFFSPPDLDSVFIRRAASAK